MDRPIRIYHNPRCSKSRQCLAQLEQAGYQAETVDYLKQPPSKAELEGLLNKLGILPSALVRRGESLYQQLGLEGQPEQVLLQAMVDHPILMERPIVVAGERAIVARPVEAALSFLAEL